MRCISSSLLILILGFAALGSAPAQQLALTFDDLPAHGDLPPGHTRQGVAKSLVKTLNAEHLPPTYGFVNADGVADRPDELSALKVWVAGGQLLGNHTWAHPDINKVTAAAFDLQILQNEPMLRSVQPNADWHWFRYPFLHEGDTLAKRREVRAWLASHGYRIAETGMDFEDYLWDDPYARCMEKHNARAIRYLHDSYLSQAAHYADFFRRMALQLYGRDVKYILLMHAGAFDAKMLPELIAMYRARGFSFTTLPDAMSDPANQADPDMADPSGGTLLEQTLARRNLHYPADTVRPAKKLDAICR